MFTIYLYNGSGSPSYTIPDVGAAVDLIHRRLNGLDGPRDMTATIVWKGRRIGKIRASMQDRDEFRTDLTHANITTILKGMMAAWSEAPESGQRGGRGLARRKRLNEILRSSRKLNDHEVAQQEAEIMGLFTSSAVRNHDVDKAPRKPNINTRARLALEDNPEVAEKLIGFLSFFPSGEADAASVRAFLSDFLGDSAAASVAAKVCL